MTPDEIWSEYTSAIVEIESLLHATRSATKSEMQQLLKNEKIIRQRNSDQSIPISMQNMVFRDVRTGKHVFYGHKDITIDEVKHRLLLRKNKQYQWLLVEAYEAFEKFLVHIYALVGAACQDCWPMTDYGNTTIAAAIQNKFPWYLEQARKKKDLPNSVLTVLRRKYPGISSVERDNHSKVHLGFAIALIARLRHQIVHKSGWTQSKADFIDGTAKAVGLYNNGSVPEPCMSFANSFFGMNEYENMIALLEVHFDPNIPIDIDTYVCRVGVLLEILLGYGHMLVQFIHVDTSKGV